MLMVSKVSAFLKELTVREKRKRRELVNPPRIVKSSEEANFPL